jgi:hypothetical protein
MRGDVWSRQVLVLAIALITAAIAACDSDEDQQGDRRVSDAPTAAPDAPDRRRSPDRGRARDTVVLDVEPRVARDAITYRDRKHRLRVTYPSGWHRARANLIPRMAPPGGILAVGSSPLRREPRAACSGEPNQPEIEVGPQDALVLVYEEGGARADLAPTRPRRFRLRKQLRPADPRDLRGGQLFPWTCLNRVGIVGLWTFFGEQRRVFYLTAVVGESASPLLRSQTLAVLNSLRFDR